MASPPGRREAPRAASEARGPRTDELVWRSRLVIVLVVPIAAVGIVAALGAAVRGVAIALRLALRTGAPAVLPPLADALRDLLLATALLTVAIGLYQLYVRPLSSQQWRAGVPRGLHVASVAELRDRLLSLFVPIAMIVFIAKIPELHGTRDIGLALGALVVSALLIVFVRGGPPHPPQPAPKRTTLEFPAGMFADDPVAALVIPPPRERKLSDPFLAAERITRPRAPVFDPARRFVPVLVVLGVGGIATAIGIVTLRSARSRAPQRAASSAEPVRQTIVDRPAEPRVEPTPIVTALPVPAPSLAPRRGSVVLKVRCRSGVVLHVFLDGEDTATSCDGHQRIRTTPGEHVIGLLSPSTGKVRELRRALRDPETRLWVRP